MSMQDITQTAEDLGEKIAAEPATKKFIEAQKAISDDEDAKKLVQEFQQHAQKLARLEAEGKPVEVADKHALTDLQNKLAGNDVVKTFMTAQMEYADLMRKVNQALMGKLGPAAEPSPTDPADEN